MWLVEEVLPHEQDSYALREAFYNMWVSATSNKRSGLLKRLPCDGGTCPSFPTAQLSRRTSIVFWKRSSNAPASDSKM